MNDRVTLKSKANGLKVVVDGVTQIEVVRGVLCLKTHGGERTFDESMVAIVRIDKNASARAREAINE